MHIDYTITDNQIKLLNNPDEDNYYFWLKVKAVDPLNNQAESEIQGLFEGNDVEIGGGYDDDMADCLYKLNKKFKADTFMANLEEVEWVPRNYPPPDQLLTLVDRILQIDDLDVDEVISQLRLIHGHSFYRAAGSQAAVRSVAGRRLRDLGR